MTALDKYTCEQVFQRLDDYLDRALAPGEAEQVQRHLETCAACAAEHRFQAGVIDQVSAKLQRVAAPQGLLARISGALRQEQRDHGAGQKA